MTNTHIELVRQAIPLWYANVAWAKELLVRTFGLADPQAILSGEHRRLQAIPNTCWFVRPHGIGVDIFKSPEVGGIDFTLISQIRMSGAWHCLLSGKSMTASYRMPPTVSW